MLAVTVAGGTSPVEVPIPKRIPGESLVKVERVGICGTDLQLFQGYRDFRGIIGHEFAGTVIDSDRLEWLGKPVTASINLPGKVEGYSWERAKHDPHRKALGIHGRDGVMAEYAVIPDPLLIPLPKEMDFATGAFAEPLAAAIHAVNCLPETVKHVLLLGDGKLGQLIGRVLAAEGYHASVLGLSPVKLKLLEQQGFDILTVDQCPENSFDAVIEATGNSDGIRTALNCVKPTGTIIFKSTVAGESAIDLSRVVVDEITLIGSRCGDVEEAVHWLSEQRIQTTGLISAVFPLAQSAEAFEYARQPETLKVQLSPFGH